MIDYCLAEGTTVFAKEGSATNIQGRVVCTYKEVLCWFPLWELFLIKERIIR